MTGMNTMRMNPSLHVLAATLATCADNVADMSTGPPEAAEMRFASDGGTAIAEQDKEAIRVLMVSCRDYERDDPWLACQLADEKMAREQNALRRSNKRTNKTARRGELRRYYGR
jgi:hypothetical protein